jgi:hypothetical protein
MAKSGNFGFGAFSGVEGAPPTTEITPAEGQEIKLS